MKAVPIPGFCRRKKYSIHVFFNEGLIEREWLVVEVGRA
jgi:hypothetical protein